jgi:putative acetyltransferase
VTQKVKVEKANPASKEARALIAQLDAYLNSLYPAESNYLLSAEALQQPNVTFLTAQIGGKTVGCGAYVNHDGEYAEIKRMFVLPAFRGRRIGQHLLEELELRAGSSGIKLSRLETGIYQKEALGLYGRAGYKRRGGFGDYRADDPLCVFMEKSLI